MINRRDFLKLSAILPAMFGNTIQQSEPYIYLEGSGGDDTQTLQAAFDTLNEQYGYTGMETVVVLKGVFRLSSTVNLWDKYRVRVLGLDCAIVGNLDCKGSTYLTIERVHVQGNISFSRGAGGKGGALHLVDCMLHGNLYLDDADTSAFERVTVYGQSVLRQYAYTCKGNLWRDCWFAGDVFVRGLVQSVRFDSCYFTAPIHFEGDAYNVTFDNAIVEGIPVFIHVTGRVNNLDVRNLNTSSGVSPIIVIDTDRVNYYWRMDNPSKGASTAKYIHIQRGSLYGAHIVCNSYDIQNDGEIKASFINCLGTQPVGGNKPINSQVVSAYYGKLP